MSSVKQEQIPSLTTQQMIEVDRAMVEDFNIVLIQMMENAGRNLANLARTRFLNGLASGNVAVLAGTGANGGGACVAARHLHNWGVSVEVVITKPESAFTPIPAHQLCILRQMKVPIFELDGLEELQSASLIIDGIIGYSLNGAPRNTAAALIQWANAANAPVLSLDVPSGMDAGQGMVYEPCIRADATMTLALPKRGLLTREARALLGELYLADISVPPSLYRTMSPSVSADSIFQEQEIVRVLTGE